MMFIAAFGHICLQFSLAIAGKEMQTLLPSAAHMLQGCGMACAICGCHLL